MSRMYGKMIVDWIGCDPADAEEIEEIMRDVIFCSTLDWQTKRQFVKAAKEAQAMLPGYRKVKAEIAAKHAKSA